MMWMFGVGWRMWDFHHRGIGMCHRCMVRIFQDVKGAAPTDWCQLWLVSGDVGANVAVSAAAAPANPKHCASSPMHQMQQL